MRRKARSAEREPEVLSELVMKKMGIIDRVVATLATASKPWTLQRQIRRQVCQTNKFKITLTLFNTLLSRTILNEVGKRIEHCCKQLRKKKGKKENERHSTGWPNVFNMLNSTMLNGVKWNIARFSQGL